MDTRSHDNHSQHAGVDDLLKRVQTVSNDTVHIGTYLQMQLYPDNGIILDEASKTRIAAMSMSLNRQAMQLLAKQFKTDEGYVKSFCEEYVCAPDLLRYIFSRVVEWNYVYNQKNVELSPDLQRRIENKDAQVSEKAMSALVAQSRFVGCVENYRYSLEELPAELAYELIWDAANYLIKAKVAPRSEIKKQAKAVLADFDESVSRISCQLRHAVVTKNSVLPSKDTLISDIGISQFFAFLSIHSSVGLNQLYILSAMQDRAAFAAVLRITGFSGKTILQILEQLKLPHHISDDFDETALNALGVDNAKAIISHRPNGGDL